MVLTEDKIKQYHANQGYVYLIHAVGTNRYKIGRSINPVARFQVLKGQSPYPLKIIDCFWTPDAHADEKFLHKQTWLLPKRAYGEWFEFSEEIVDFNGRKATDIELIKNNFKIVSPTCNSYLKVAMKRIIQNCPIPPKQRTIEMIYKLNMSLHTIYKEIKTIDQFKKIVEFTIDHLPLYGVPSQSIYDLTERVYIACNTTAILLFGEHLERLKEKQEFQRKGIIDA